MGIPLQHECDMSSPEEHALWALVGLPGPGQHAPLVMPPAVLKQWSKRLWELGFRHDPDLQELKYVPPAADSNWVAGAAGRWVNVNAVLPAEDTAPDVSHLSADEKRVLLERLAAEMTPAQQEQNEDIAEVDNG